MPLCCHLTARWWSRDISGLKATYLWSVEDAWQSNETSGLKTGDDVDFSPDGQYIVMDDGHDRHELKIVNVTTGKTVGHLVGHRHIVCSIRFSPDGTRVATGANDSVKVWDLASRRELLSLETNDWYNRQVEWSPDGNSILVISGHGKLSVWRLPPWKRFWPRSSVTIFKLHHLFRSVRSSLGRRFVARREHLLLRLTTSPSLSTKSRSIRTHAPTHFSFGAVRDWFGSTEASSRRQTVRLTANSPCHFAQSSYRASIGHGRLTTAAVARPLSVAPRTETRRLGKPIAVPPNAHLQRNFHARPLQPGESGIALACRELFSWDCEAHLIPTCTFDNSQDSIDSPFKRCCESTISCLLWFVKPAQTGRCSKPQPTSAEPELQ